MTVNTRPRLQSRHWLGKTTAGAFFGLAIALILTSAFTLLVQPADPEAMSGKAQFVMWMVAPIWAGILSLVFLFRDGKRAWLWLGVATAVAYVLLRFVHAMTA